MPQDPIDRLLAEHTSLQLRLAPLRALIEHADSGAPLSPAHAARVFSDVSRVMSTELLAHARREDDVFFPAVEHVLGSVFGPTQVMRVEHAEIHRGIDRFRDTLRQIHEVEHPAIEATGDALGDALSRGADPRTLLETGRGLLALVDSHFEKEELILFPMSRQLLGVDARRELAEAMEAADARATAPSWGR